MWFKTFYGIKKTRKVWLILGVAVFTVTAFAAWPYWKKHREPTHWDYVNIKEFIMQESYPSGFMQLQIDFKKRTIYFHGRNSFNVYRTFTKDEKEELIGLLEQYRFLEWPDGSYYMQNWKHVYARRTGIPLTEDEYYMGLGKKEVYLRSTYECRLWYSSYTNKYMNSLLYDKSGFPEGYNELLDSVWDFVFRHDIQDERLLYDEWTEEDGKEAYLDRKQEGMDSFDYEKMFYFSINEFFGGQDGAPGCSLSYWQDVRYEQVEGSIEYRPWLLLGSDVNRINFVDKEVNIQKYREKDNWWEHKWLEKQLDLTYSTLDLNKAGKEKLLHILKKYDVASWKEAEYYQNQPQPNRIRAGEFFNLNPEIYYEGVGELEHTVRSSFESFIYLYNTDGRYIRLRYGNTGLPENYNEFRQELWDFEMEYLKNNTSHLHDEYDWRNQLDQWGMYYLEDLREKEAETQDE